MAMAGNIAPPGLALLVASALLCLGAPVNVLQAADFFVIDNGGPTGGDGSLGNPWGTITEAINSGSLFPGDTLNSTATVEEVADGIVKLKVETTKQDGSVVLSGYATARVD